MLIITIFITSCTRNTTETVTSELPPASATSEEPPESNLDPISTGPELFIIDNTPADTYVDIAAGASNPANNLPWAAAGESIRVDGRIAAIRYEEVNLSDDKFTLHNLGFTWQEILQVEPDTLQISNAPDELSNLPLRRIQNRDAARVVANEILDLLSLYNQGVIIIEYDSENNIWIFTFGSLIPPTDTLGMGMNLFYAVNGYNGQIIRAWIS